MKIDLLDAGKRFNREWIFRHLSYKFLPGKKYAITGPNGSGKSTLLQLIAGAVMHSEGNIEYSIYTEESGKAAAEKGLPVMPEEAFNNISIAAPYLELPEEMTAEEFLKFHAKFKKLRSATSEILAAVGISDAAKKQIRYYSSGMKQRLKLGQAFFSDTSVLLLDEPTGNLDAEGVSIYKKLINACDQDRLVIISSNDAQEYSFCDEILRVNDFKI